MGVTDLHREKQGAPPPGVYAVFTPYGEEASVAAALLTQELAVYGTCAYVNMSAFPHFYIRDSVSGNHHLGELFFRLEGESYDALVRESQIPYGRAVRVPSISHYRDLWDIHEEDRKRFLERLNNDCQIPYIVVLFNDIREAMPAVSFTTRFCILLRGHDPDACMERWHRYARTEKQEGAGVVVALGMPESWGRWIAEMEQTAPEVWLEDREKKEFASRLWREEANDGSDTDRARDTVT